LQDELESIGESFMQEDMATIRAGGSLPSATPRGYWDSQPMFAVWCNKLLSAHEAKEMVEKT
jgi:hypothetical protein